MLALTPNNLTDTPDFIINFMKEIPITWDETLYIDGYPGKYAVIARRRGDTWYVAGVNALKEPVKLELSLPMYAGTHIKAYNDNSRRETGLQEIQVKQKGLVKITIQPGGGFVLTN